MNYQRPIHRWLAAAGLLAILNVSSAAGAAASAQGGDSFPWQRYLDYPNPWYGGIEAKQIVTNVLSHQSPQGGWPKGVDTGAQKFEGDPADLRGSFENSATLGELRFLARVVRVTNDERSRAAVDKGVKHIIGAQFPSGGWSLSSPPPPKSVNRHILFEGNCMANIMLFLNDVATTRRYTFLRKDTRDAAKKAVDLGVECILRCQIVDDNGPTVWCARHDEKTFRPLPGRRGDPAALNACESATLLLLLMNLEDPSAATVQAVHAGCAWYENALQAGITVTRKNDDVAVVPALEAPPLWARYYEIGKNRPIFTTRTGAVKLRLSDIEAERRAELPWYGAWGRPVLFKYATWKEKHPQ